MQAGATAIDTADWLERAARFPIAFAQVREDALIDRWIVRQLPLGAHGLMIASGGCTAACLATAPTLERLGLVDANAAQLAAARLKIDWITDYAPAGRRARLGHDPMPPGDRRRAVEAALARHGFPADIFGDADEVAELGLDQAGRYERLFARLRHVLSEAERTERLFALPDVAAQNAFLAQHPDYLIRLEAAFDEVMALPNLVRLFGDKATQNAKMPFARHFLGQTVRAMRTLPVRSNPWLSQLLRGSFGRRSYPWLRLPRTPVRAAIELRQAPMADALEAEAAPLDFIHLSNILDWLSEAEASALLRLVTARLKPGGWVVIRQLNSNLSIPALAPGIAWQDKAAGWLKVDRSFFYRRLHIGRKA